MKSKDDSLKRVKKLFSIWYPDYLVADQRPEVYLRFIIGLSYLGVIVELSYLVLNLINGIPIFPTNLPLLGFSSLLLIVRYARAYWMVAHAFLCVFAVTIVGLCTYYQSFPFTILLWTPVFANMSVYLVGKRQGCFWTLLLGGFMAVFFLYDPTNTGFGYNIDREQLRSIALVSVILTMASALYSSVLFHNCISKLNREMARKNAVLLQKKRQVEQSIKEKELLISLVCHDIANPLRTIAFAVSTTKDKEVSGDGNVYQEFLKTVARSTDTIAEIIEDVSKMQAIELGKVKLDLRPVNLGNVIDKIKLLFADHLKEKNLQLIFECDDTSNLWVEAEEHSLTNSVLSNLVSNAIKFSEPNQPIILQARVDYGSIKLVVKDFGIGMPPSLLGDLFKHYKPTSRVGTRGEKGTGFGMPITKVYMDHYHGDIAVFSKEKALGIREHGTTFILTFKRAQALEVSLTEARS